MSVSGLNSTQQTLKKLLQNSTGKIGSGNATEPGLAFKSDTNTGLFRVSEDAIGITTGGAERVRISSSGLQVGNTSSDGIIRDIRHGKVAPATSTGTVTFANGPMLSVPTVLGQIESTNTALLYTIVISNVTTTGFSFCKKYYDGAIGPASSDQFWYIAISK